MNAIRFHGRGGQGVVTAAELLSVAAFLDGRFAQAFPSFGSERMGAPVAAFCRVDDGEIRLREPIDRPDAIVVMDPTLLPYVDVFQGLDDGYVLINSRRTPEELGLADLVGRLPPGRVRCVAATDLARRLVGRPLPNAALLGALAAETGYVTLDSVCAAIRERFSASVGEKNAAAARAAHDLVRGEAAPC
jgi:pyruvate ferredoxin oxidoreductase gamma subunit